MLTMIWMIILPAGDYFMAAMLDWRHLRPSGQTKFVFHRIPRIRKHIYMYSTGKLGFDPDIWNNKLKLSGYVEEAYLTTVPKVPKNPVAGFSKMVE